MWCGFVPLFIPLALSAQSEVSLQVSSVITLHPSDIAITAETHNGGDWMTTAVFSTDAQAVIQVNASAANLSPGTYTATITVTSGTLTPVRIPVALTVVAAPTANTLVTATPPSISMHPQPGQTETQSIWIDSAGTPILVNVSDRGQMATPATITIQAYGGQIPGASIS